MKQKFIWRSLIVISILLGFASTVFNADAERKYIYYRGNMNNYPSGTSDEVEDSAFDKYRIYETNEGSNVYEGVISNSGYRSEQSYFNFFYGHRPQNNSMAYYVNWIHPATNDYFEFPMHQVVCQSQAVANEYLPAQGLYNPPSWSVKGSNAIRFIVDLNKNTMTAITEGAYYLVLDSNQKPSVQYAIDNLPALIHGNVIDIPAGAHTIRVYDALNDQLLGVPSEVPEFGEDSAWGDISEDYFKASYSQPYKVNSKNGCSFFKSSEGFKVISNQNPTPQKFTDAIFTTAELKDAKLDAHNVSYCGPALYYITKEGNEYKGIVELIKGQQFRFYTDLGENADQSIVMGPGNDGNLHFADNLACSSCKKGHPDEVGYWTSPITDYVEITLKASGEGHDALQLKMQQEEPRNVLYLVGHITNWEEPKEKNRDYYKNFELHPIKYGNGYYGEFDIPAGKAMFRFYADLSGWDGGASIGCQEYDEPMDFYFFDDVQVTIPAKTRGAKGNFNIVDWEGGKMYILVTPSDTYGEAVVTLSKTPLNIEAIDPDEKKKDVMYASVDGRSLKMQPVSEGVYKVAFNTDKSLGSRELRIFTKDLGLSVADPYWEGSYALCPTLNNELAFDDLGVAETTFTVNDKISTEKVSPFVFHDDADALEYFLTVDMNSNMFYLDKHSVNYLVGGISDYELPSYATRAKFKDLACAVSHCKIINIPAGKFDFSFYNLGGKQFYNQVTHVIDKFDYNGIYRPEDDGNWEHSYIRNSHIKCPTWHGGKVYIDGGCIQDMTNLTNISVYTYSDETDAGEYRQYNLSKVESGDGRNVFRGTVGLLLNKYGVNQLNVYLPGGSCSFGSKAFYGNNGMAFMDEMDIHMDGESASMSLYPGGYAYRFPQFEKAKLDVTVDLDNMTMNVTTLEMVESQLFDLQNSEGASIKKVKKFDKQDCEFGCIIKGTELNDGKFSLSSTTGELLMPVNPNISFDEYGVWTGEYRSINSASRESSNLYWHLPAGTVESVIVLINRDDNTVKVVSGKAVEKHYYVTICEDYLFVSPTEYLSIRDNVMDLKDGIFTAKCKIPSNWRFIVHNGFMGNTMDDINLFGFAPCSYPSTFVLEDGIAEKEVYAVTYTQFMSIEGSEDKEYVIEYDPAKYLLIVKDDSYNGVYTPIAVIGSKLAMYGEQGAIRIDAAEESTVSIYSLNGALIKNVNVKAGTTRVPMNSGIYIANGSKVLVR